MFLQSVLGAEFRDLGTCSCTFFQGYQMSNSGAVWVEIRSSFKPMFY